MRISDWRSYVCSSDLFQMTYYLMLLILVFMGVELVFAIRNKTFPAFAKSSAVLLGAVVLAIGVNFGSLWVNYEYAKETTRGKSELTADVTGQEATGGMEKERTEGRRGGKGGGSTGGVWWWREHEKK